MKLTLKKMITPVCIALMLVTQLANYFLNGDINLFILATACFVSPQAIKDLKPSFSSSNLRNVFLITGLIIMSIGFYIEFII